MILKRLFFLFTFIILHSSIASAIEVGGHITEDTTWSSANNPYLVTENLYIDSDVTLTILPGTEIKISGAELSNVNDYVPNFWLNSNGWSLAKYIRVDGRIIAEGTEQDKIIFTRMQDDMNYNWGSVCITVDAELCVFEHCIFEHMGNTGLAVSNISNGLDFFNGKGIVRNNKFLNCAYSIDSVSYEKKLEIIHNEFIINDNINPYLLDFNYGQRFILTDRIGTVDDKDALICGNFFDGLDVYAGVVADSLSFAYNRGDNCYGFGGTRANIYKNEFNSCITSVGGKSVFVKDNRFIGGNDGINLYEAYAEISGNYFEDCDLELSISTDGIIYNNIVKNGSLHCPGEIKLFNNISYNGNTGIVVTYRNEINTNNVSINNLYAFGGVFYSYYNNSVIMGNNELTEYGVSGNPIFRNCIIDFPLDPPLVDGGGNIIVDEEQAQQIFVAIENGNFHLAEGSIAIDAGFDTLGYYYPFDIANSVRVWDGDGDGNAIIDIGAYEYGAPQLGTICGFITETFSGNPVDYVKILVDNEPGEFTFADSSGYFEIQLPEGTYDLYAERVFYEDNIIYTVTVENEQVTPVFFNMTYNDPLVSVEDNEININNSELRISNYPNPFKPSGAGRSPGTTISFSTEQYEQYEQIEIEIFNVKGQRIVTLSDPVKVDCIEGEQTYSSIWNGLDENNKPVSSGVYLYKVKAGKQEAVKQMLLLK